MNHPPRTPVERAMADAAALVRVASPEDWPGGFVIVDERLPTGIGGVAVGGGLGVAGALGLRDGVRAVLVNARHYLATPDAPADADLANLERAACHEAAHALTTPDISPAVAGRLLERVEPLVGGYAAITVARQHDPRWAAAYSLLVARGAAFRPARRGALLREYAARDLARYGYAAVEVERVTRGANPAVPLRRLLERGGPAAALLANVLPNDDTRAAAVVAAGIVRGTQPTGVVA